MRKLYAQLQDVYLVVLAARAMRKTIYQLRIHLATAEASEEALKVHWVDFQDAIGDLVRKSRSFVKDNAQKSAAVEAFRVAKNSFHELEWIVNARFSDPTEPGEDITHDVESEVDGDLATYVMVALQYELELYRAAKEDLQRYRVDAAAMSSALAAIQRLLNMT